MVELLPTDGGLSHHQGVHHEEGDSSQDRQVRDSGGDSSLPMSPQEHARNDINDPVGRGVTSCDKTERCLSHEENNTAKVTDTIQNTNVKRKARNSDVKPGQIRTRLCGDEAVDSPVKGISINVFIVILHSHLGDGTRSRESFKVTGHTDGSYHEMVFIKFEPDNIEYVIKVPFVGYPGAWTRSDRYQLQREVDMMFLIKSNTNIPIPEIIGYEDNIDVWGFPYIAMTKLPGRPAYELWFDEYDYNGYTGSLEKAFASEATERKRHNLLKSLAKYMVQLETLEYNETGLPNLDTHPPTITT